MAIPAVPPTTLLLWSGLGALIVWRIYSRVRRVIGRQRYSRYRPWITVVLFPLLLVLLSLGALTHPVAMATLWGGVAIGAMLGLYGLRLTKFEQTPQGLYYTPNAHLGIALSLLLIGRIAFRFAQVALMGGAAAAPPGDFLNSPITLAIFGTLAGYYVCYAVGLIRWDRSLVPLPESTAVDTPKESS